MNKLQKRILMVLIALTLLTPAGILLPMFFNAGDAWGEWSAETVNSMIGYVPEGLAKYADTYKAPLSDYTANSNDSSVIHQSGYYILSGVVGVVITLGVMFIISKIIVKKNE
jgi:ABC-type transport system involved in multi-copper enzyme maturation permease subunit